ncbi:tRNA (adenosine(37)-N6)-threonylcarbamoyltransferase complex dimerization subunit type 1 TsaB [Flavobacterium sp.]|jgi:tRNA threonylcarbamoyladenosine biosynthesis protein TsaB|uniref:tRNA (adenosine(37)-N6)-threonylcarbamoyltransferase complex dimerization subunit type 1 TsaB n=1 Tax=Flavobacterium sp. TaxID=239 RepID=UPI00333E583C
MALLLCLETATRNCSVALAREGQVISLREKAEEGYTHAEKLHVFIEEVLQEAGVLASELDAVAVSKGPGSYTGLRIGVSAAKGLCYALQIPLISVSTLQILAHATPVNEGYIIPLIDARRMEVYTAVFDAYGKPLSAVEAMILNETSFEAWQGPCTFVGDCMPKAKTVLTHPRFQFLESVIFPSAQTMAKLAETLYQEKQFEDVAYFEPFYLKNFMVNP